MSSKRAPLLPKTTLSVSNSNFFIDSKLKCKNCKKYFNPDNNGNCWYHDGKELSDGLRVYNQYDKVSYTCCHDIREGYTNTYNTSKGCKFSEKHISI